MRVIAGTAKGRTLKTPEGMLTRPTAERVKEAVFSAVQFDLPGAKVLDLFAGTGQLGIEALSRGADRAVFVDDRKEACALVRENLRITGFLDRARVVQGDYLTYLKSCRERFTMVFLDPPYAEKFLETALNQLSEIDILNKDAIIVTERPLGKVLSEDFPRFERLKDRKYGKTVIALFRYIGSGEAE